MPTSVVVSIPKSAVAGAVDNAFEEALDCIDEQPSKMTIDLTDCSYIQLPSLFLFLSVISVRDKEGLSTIFRLPKDKTVRDFLRLKKFAGAIKEITGREFFTFVHEDDRRYFHGRGGDGGSFSYPNANALSNTSFPLMCRSTNAIIAEQDIEYDQKEYFHSSIRREDEMWNQDHIMTVLRQILLDPDYLVSHVVYEALSNAYRHPGASKICFASHTDIPKLRQIQTLDEISEKSVPGFFTLCYWDNGQSIYETLSPEPNNHTIVTTKNKNYLVNILCKTKDKAILIPEILSNNGKSRLSSIYEVFLGAFLPGTTRDSTGNGNLIHDRIEIHDHSSSVPGYGLSNLVKAACFILPVERLKGSVFVRSGKLFASIKGKQSNTSKRTVEQTYDANINELGKSELYFRGNLITVTISVNIPKRLLAYQSIHGSS